MLYGDYECPYTRAAYRTVQALEAGRTPMTLCHRHMPLTEIHPHALQAAVAAEAAHDQGRFWDMHDLLFARQDALGREDLRRYAETLNLDVDRFNAEFASDRQLEKITRDVRGGLEGGVTGTPALFVDGESVGGYDIDTLMAALTR